MRAKVKEESGEGKESSRKVAQMSRTTGVTEDLPCHRGPFVSHLNNNPKVSECQDQLLKRSCKMNSSSRPKAESRT